MNKHDEQTTTQKTLIRIRDTFTILVNEVIDEEERDPQVGESIDAVNRRPGSKSRSTL